MLLPDRTVLVLVGDDGAQNIEDIQEPMNKDSENVFTFWCSGRICCEGKKDSIKVYLPLHTRVCGVIVNTFSRRWGGDGSILGPNRAIAKGVKSCIYCCYVRCVTFIVCVGRIPWSQIGATHYHVQTKVVQSKGWLCAIVRI